MDTFRIERVDFDYLIERSDLRSKVENPVFVEGLLGVGHVGFLAASHLVDEFDFEKIADLYSPHFHHPVTGGGVPGVVYSLDGTAELHRNEIFYNREHDLFVYRGLYQADYCEFYYRHANRIMDFCQEFGVKRIYTLGGLGTGKEQESPETHAVITDAKLTRRIEKFARVLKGRENQPGVTGISGLLIGLAEKNNMEGICLLGETHGAYPDPIAAKSVLSTLGKMIGFEVDLHELDEAAKEMGKRRKEFEEMSKVVAAKMEEGGREAPYYIG